ncbi:hypothetical protein ACG7TL_009174 [Trametes sanguinea]
MSLETVMLKSLRKLSLDGVRHDINAGYLQHLTYAQPTTLWASWSPIVDGWNLPPALVHAISLQGASELILEILQGGVRFTYRMDGIVRVVLRVYLPQTRYDIEDGFSAGFLAHLSACSSLITKLEIHSLRTTINTRYLEDARIKALLAVFPRLVSLVDGDTLADLAENGAL